VPIHRRSSGSLSPRLIQFKRRESIDNIINEEKNHEHEVNDVNNLNCKVEDLLDRNKKIPNTVTPSNSPNRRSIGKQFYIPSRSSACSSPTRSYHRAQSPLTSISSTSTVKKRKLGDDHSTSEPSSKKPTFRPTELRSSKSDGSKIGRSMSLSSCCSFECDSSNSPHSCHEIESFQPINQ